MEQKPNSQPKTPAKPAPKHEADTRLAGLDDETLRTLGAAIGQLSGIHDPNVLAH